MVSDKYENKQTFQNINKPNGFYKQDISLCEIKKLSE